MNEGEQAQCDLDARTQTLQGINAHMMGLEDHLKCIADRVYGAAPELGRSEGNPVDADSAFSRLDETIASLRSTVDRLEDQIGRMSGL